MSQKDKQQGLVEKMKSWQKLEKAAVTQTARLMEQTEHPLIRAVAEIIQRDSHMHFRVQQLIIDSYETASVPVLIDQLEQIWDAVEQHINIEQRTVELARASLDEIKGTRNVVQEYLLNYLLADEQKHDRLLADLELIKKKMYP